LVRGGLGIPGALLAAIVAAIVATTALEAKAFVCASNEVQQYITRTPVVFTGRVVASAIVYSFGNIYPFSNVQAPKEPFAARATFEVVIPWKGVTDATVVVRSGSVYAPWYHEGYAYTVYAFPSEDGTLLSDPCTAFPLLDRDAYYSTLRELKPEFLRNAVPVVPQQAAAMMKAEATFRASYGDSESALMLFTSVLGIDPQDRDSLLGRGQLLMDSKGYAAALDDITALLRLDPEHSIAKRWRSIALFNLGRFQEIDGAGADLSRGHYRKIDASRTRLTNINLSWSDLGNVQFVDADLEGANLGFASLMDVSFRNAKLSGADFRGARLLKVDLSGADLSNADLRYAQILGANLEGARLTGAKYNGQTRWPMDFRPETTGAVRVEEE